MEKKNHDKSFLKKVGQRIVALRNEKNISQEELAELASLDLRQIGRVERGEVNTGIQTIALIALALRIEPKDIFDI